MIRSLGLIVIIAASSFPLHNAEGNGNKAISQDVLNKLARGRREFAKPRNRDEVIPQVFLNKLADHLDEKQESVPEASQENENYLNELAQDHVERQDTVDDSPNKTKRANFLFNIKESVDKMVQSGCRKMGKFSILRKLASSSIGRKVCKIPPAPPLPDTAPAAAKLKWYESLGWSSTQADPEDKDKGNQENLNMLAQDQVERQDAVDDSPNKMKRANFFDSIKEKLKSWRNSGCDKLGKISFLKKLTESVKICKSDGSNGVAAVEDTTNTGSQVVLQPDGDRS